MAIGKAKAKRTSGSNEWWEVTAEAPRAGLPTAEKQRKRARWWRAYAWMAVVLLPLAVLANVLILGTQGSANTGVAKAAPDKYAETRSVALVAVREWLAADPSPLPGGMVIGWDSATSDTWNPPATEDLTSTSQGTYRIETHRVTLSTTDGAMFTASVPVVYDKAHGAVVTEAPALAPVLPADESWLPNQYPDLSATAPGDDVTTAVAAWVTAYASGDPALLRQTVGDPDAAHAYLPLSGARLRDPSTSEAWVVELAPATSDGADRLPRTLIARVTAKIDWAVAPIENPSEAPDVTFDVLVENADTAAPKVVAWGGPGEGAHLKRYGNAITSRAIAADLGGDEFEDEGTTDSSDDTGATEDDGSITPPDDVTDPDSEEAGSTDEQTKAEEKAAKKAERKAARQDAAAGTTDEETTE